MSRTVSPALLLFEAARRHHCKPAEIIGPRRHAWLVQARRDVAMALRAIGWTFNQIGQLLGGRHPSTVMNLCGCFDASRFEPVVAA